MLKQKGLQNQILFSHVSKWENAAYLSVCKVMEGAGQAYHRTKGPWIIVFRSELVGQRKFF